MSGINPPRWLERLLEWALPEGVRGVRVGRAGRDDGDRQMVEILTDGLADGLAAVGAACAEAPVRGA